MWRKGMKAVCVHAGPGGSKRPTPLERGKVYLVERVANSIYARRTFNGVEPAGCVLLVLRGVAGPWMNNKDDIPGWCATRFRPLVSRTEEQDVSMFKRIADSPPAKGREVEREYSEGV